MNSIWLEHPKYPGYRFSPEGNCLSLRQGRNKLRKLQRRAGYWFLSFYSDGVKVQQNMHVILAEIYLPEPLKGRNYVNHIDGNGFNNSIENLEWVTHQENRLHACRILRKGIGSKNGNSVLNEKQVEEIKTLLSAGETHKSIAKKFSIARTTVTAINCGETWSERRNYK